jgi:hypothetical protein
MSSPRPTCTAPDCARETVARGLCGTHHSQWRRTGSVRPIGTAPGDGRRISVRLDAATLEAAQEAADADGTQHVAHGGRRKNTPGLRPTAG